MRIGLVALVLAMGIAGTADSATKPPRLLLADASPLTIRGAGFGKGERVRVTVRSAGTATVRHVRASAVGAFLVTFTGMTADRCSLVRVVALRPTGRTVELKLLPAPACPPA